MSSAMNAISAPSLSASETAATTSRAARQLVMPSAKRSGAVARDSALRGAESLGMLLILLGEEGVEPFFEDRLVKRAGVRSDCLRIKAIFELTQSLRQRVGGLRAEVDAGHAIYHRL